ncbi:MAG: multidrug efflux SMR transporter [Pseudomonadota bacterium]
MTWVYLLLAGVFEVVFAVGLKASNGFTKPVPTSVFVLGMIASFWFLALAMRELPAGVAYSVWTGLGAIGTVAVAAFLFRETLGFGTLAGVALILSGIVVIRLTSTA